MQTGILAAVGVDKTNNDVDVEVIQKLLNRVPNGLGNPQPRLAEDGDCGPKTIAAIRGFQQKSFGAQDGVVDPFKKTHNRLIELAGSSEEVPIRSELAEGFQPLILPMIQEAASALEVLRLNPDATGPRADRTREALNVHYQFKNVLDFTRDSNAGRVKKRFDDIRVSLDDRNLLWRDATVKRAKIETNEPKTVRVPAIYANPKTRASIVFTPNYKPFDPADELGYGPQMLAYTLIVGVAKQARGHLLGKPVLHSDTPGYPGPTFEEAVENPATYGGFAFQLRMGFAVPLGDLMRRV